MTVVTVGTGATIQLPTLEGQFVQLIEFFQGIEKTPGNQTTYFTGTYDSDELIFDGNFKLPITPGVAGASFTANTTNFLVGTFAPGTGGTFTAVKALDYFLEVTMKIITLQNDDSKNPQKAQNVTLLIDANQNTASGSFKMPFTKSVTSTGLAILPSPYLL